MSPLVLLLLVLVAIVVAALSVTIPVSTVLVVLVVLLLIVLSLAVVPAVAELLWLPVLCIDRRLSTFRTRGPSVCPPAVFSAV